MSIARVVPFQYHSPARFGAGKPPKAEAKPVLTPEQQLVELQDYIGKISKTQTLTYREEFQKTLDSAKKFLENYLKKNPASKGAVVLDLDETLLDNSGNLMLRKLPNYRGYFQYLDWMQSSEAPAIPETKAFVDWVIEKGFNLYFVTARKEKLRAATEKNLTRIGLPTGSYAKLYLKPDDFKGPSASDFKVECQKDIETKGQKVLMLLGDQDTDGVGCLGKFFKLPNDFYVTK